LGQDGRKKPRERNFAMARISGWKNTHHESKNTDTYNIKEEESKILASGPLPLQFSLKKP